MPVAGSPATLVYTSKSGHYGANHAQASQYEPAPQDSVRTHPQNPGQPQSTQRRQARRGTPGSAGDRTRTGKSQRGPQRPGNPCQEATEAHTRSNQGAGHSPARAGSQTPQGPGPDRRRPRAGAAERPGCRSCSRTSPHDVRLIAGRVHVRRIARFTSACDVEHAAARMCSQCAQRSVRMAPIAGQTRRRSLGLVPPVGLEPTLGTLLGGRPLPLGYGGLTRIPRSATLNDRTAD
jgi:hypothetical protein